jgi:hypothetical protein
MPRDPERFKRYLWELTHGSEELVLPLVDFNPMGREHVAEALDRLLAIDADAVTQRALEHAATELPGDHQYRATIVLSDDIGGMWTHRHTTELKRRWNEATTDEGLWLLLLAWTSDEPAVTALEAEARATAYRALYRSAHGRPACLRDLLLQEGFTLLFAGAEPAMRAKPYAVDRYLEASDTATVFGVLFGDRAAVELGYAPVGLPANSGFAVGVALARETGRSPVEALEEG